MKETTELVKSTVVVGEVEAVRNGHSAPAPYAGYGYAADEQEESGFSRLQSYWRSARKHIWLILGIAALVTTLSAVYVARQSDVYEAKARVQVDLEVNNPGLGAMKNTSYLVEQQYQDPTYFNTQIQ